MLTCFYKFIVSEFIYPEACVGCVRNVSVWRIQTGHMDLLPLQVCRRSWQGWSLGVLTFSCQLIALIYLKISIKLFIKYFFCWFLTCVYHIYCIRIHWSWNLSLGVLENFQWAVSKLYIWIFYPHRFLEGCGEGASFCDFTCSHQNIDWFQGSSSSWLMDIDIKTSHNTVTFVGVVDNSRPKGNQGPLG